VCVCERERERKRERARERESARARVRESEREKEEQVHGTQACTHHAHALSPTEACARGVLARTLHAGC
jgi:hypothetical protein